MAYGPLEDFYSTFSMEVGSDSFYSSLETQDVKARWDMPDVKARLDTPDVIQIGSTEVIQGSQRAF